MPEDILDNLQREGVKLASITKRSLAFFIDELVVSVFVFIIFYGSIKSSSSTEEILNILNNAVGTVLLLKVIYQAFFVWYQGATPGKMLVKIEVVDENSFIKPELSQAIIRAVVRIPSESLLYLGFLWGVLSPTRQTWHDKLAKTLVVDA